MGKQLVSAGVGESLKSIRTRKRAGPLQTPQTTTPTRQPRVPTRRAMLRTRRRREDVEDGAIASEKALRLLPSVPVLVPQWAPPDSRTFLLAFGPRVMASNPMTARNRIR
jgi:hypothetical protein